MVFDERQKHLLVELKNNPIWQSILKKLNTYQKTPRYQPGKKDIESKIQVSDWKYYSGRLDERESTLTLLGLPNLEKTDE